MKLPTPVFMADISRAMQTPPPGTAQPALAPAPQPVSRTPAGPDPRTPAPQQSANSRQADEAREAKNERDRLRRKAKRAADAKAAEKKAAAPKRKKKKPARIHALTNAAVAPTKKAKRRRGRPPGAKNKPKMGLSVALVPAPGVLPRSSAVKAHDLLTQIGLAVSMLNAMPEHARKVVLDAVK